jgi:polyhydroxybutyrate depolymerase
MVLMVKNLKIYISLLVAINMLFVTTACNFVGAKPASTLTAIPIVEIQPVDSERTLTVQGMERTYFLHIPSGLNDQKSVAMVFLFHGYRESDTEARTYSGLDKIADANGFIVVYPNGSGTSSDRSWNGGGCCGYANENNIDEPAFIHAIIADVESLASVDNKRIYATGFSNGALLTYRLACEMSDTFAAVAPVAGVLLYNPCQPQQPVSLIHVHGLMDSTVPLEGGGLNPSTGEPFPPVKQSIETWTKLDGCPGVENVEQIGVVSHTTYGQCLPGVDVELYTVDGNGHTWPFVKATPISQTIWEFFAAHPKNISK